MNNGKKSYASRVMGVVLSGVIGLMSFGAQAVGSKDIEINQISSSVAAVENQEKSEQLYKTETGECCHKGDCKCLRDSKIAISEQELKESNLRPCSKCSKHGNAENQKKSEQFYRTKTGKCYHKGTCGCLKKSKIKVSEKEIKQADLRPCSKCCK